MQIGQIMLSMPNAYAKMGLTAGLIMSVASGLISAYTIVLLVHLYEERKRRLVWPVCRHHALFPAYRQRSRQKCSVTAVI